jgi:formylmethanofuran dehydrogenase subunit B
VIGPHASGHGAIHGLTAIDTGIAGIHTGGTAMRMDEVMLPLRPCLERGPDATAIVRALTSRCLEKRRP